MNIDKPAHFNQICRRMSREKVPERNGRRREREYGPAFSVHACVRILRYPHGPAVLRNGLGIELLMGNDLDNHEGLRVRNFEPCPASWVWADEKIVHPHHVVPGFAELRAVKVVGTRREIFFLCAPQPANLKFPRFAALRALIEGLLRLNRFRVKIFFVHHPILALNHRIARIKTPEEMSSMREKLFAGNLLHFFFLYVGPSRGKFQIPKDIA